MEHATLASGTREELADKVLSTTPMETFLKANSKMIKPMDLENMSTKAVKHTKVTGLKTYRRVVARRPSPTVVFTRANSVAV